MKRIILGLLLLWSALAFALPSVEQVQAELKAGRYVQAEQMMKEVVAARPNSAKAHYVYAEILAHNGRFEQAAQQAQEAKRIDPKVGFADPAKFSAFEQLLQREQAQARQSAQQPRTGGSLSTPVVPSPITPATTLPSRASGGGIPGWLWVAGIALIAFLVWRMVSSRRNAQTFPGSAASYPMGSGMPMGGQMNPGGMPMQQPGAAGSGMLGTGIAAAGGFAAGMLAEKMLHGGHHDAPNPPGASADQGGPAIPGTLQPGMFNDDPAANELQSRDIDFGSGGDEWGGGDPGSSGGSDSDSGW
ncbi:MAG TPA: tetratricopeptide repeat protein [Burkholderiaceae bacterium]|nr:tetratricopeptide repeat protein [Burkholderiaceae bacterium]